MAKAKKGKTAAAEKAGGDGRSHGSMKVKIMSLVLVIAGAIILFIHLAPSSVFVATAACLLLMFLGALAAVHSEVYAKGGIFLSLWAIQYVVASLSYWNPLLLMLFAAIDAFLAWLLFVKMK
jgi:hypothetical protein